MTSPCGEIRTRLLSLLGDEQIAALLREHLSERAFTTVESAKARLTAAEYTVAIIGRQGVGKSSLINALLGRRIAPVDETETTNVICAFHAAPAAEERAVVLFEGGRRETRPLAEDELRMFTDEQKNPCNELRIERVDLYVDAPVLRHGIVLVDTPGVGSLTPSAERATMNYLPSIALGVFLVGTAPTLLESEALFLRATWSHSRSFVFVQNAWEGTEGEVEEARQDNLRKLEAVAREEGSGDVELVIVDVHHAVEGLRNDRPDLVALSGLPLLRQAIEERVAGGAERALVLSDGATFANAILWARTAAALRLANLDAGEDETEGAFRETTKQAEDGIADVAEKWRKTQALFEKETGESLDAFDDRLRENLSAVKDDIMELVRSRTLAAAKISIALTERLELATRAPQATLQRAFASHIEDMLDEAERLTKRLDTVVGVAVGIPDAVKRVSRTELAEKVGGIVAGVGKVVVNMGVWAVGGALFAGKRVAIAIAAGAAAVPGAGWVIAGAVLAGGYIVKKTAENHAVSALVDAVHEAVAETERRARQGVRNAVRAQQNQTTKALSLQVNAAVQQQREVLERLRSDRRVSDDERGRLRGELRANIDVLWRAETRVSDLLTTVSGAAV